MKQFEILVSELTHVLEPNHPDTRASKIEAKAYRVKVQTDELNASVASSKTAAQQVDIWAMIDCGKILTMDGQRVKVLRKSNSKDARKCICLRTGHKGNCTKIKTVQNQLIFQQGTKVVVHSLVSSKDFNGTAETTLSMLGRRLTC